MTPLRGVSHSIAQSVSQLVNGQHCVPTQRTATETKISPLIQYFTG